MIRNYFKIALRNLWKHRSVSAINIGGLAIGIASCILILQYVNFKLSFDQFHSNANDLYRVVNDRYQNGKLIQHGTITYSGVGRALNDDYEDVVENARVRPGGTEIIITENKKINEDKILFADQSFLHMFSFPLLAGNAQTALKDPFTAVISESLAKKLYGNDLSGLQSVVGERIQFGIDSTPCKITAVFKDMPANSHLQYDIILSYSSVVARWKEADYNFTQSDFWHYVQLKPGTDYKKLNARLGAFSKKHFDGNKVSGSDEVFYLQPVTRAHLYSDFEYEIGQTGSATVVWSLLAIALFIISLAWVNYINLATARSVERAREVGIRKVVGGLKKQLMFQFMMESLLVNFIAILMAILLVWLLQGAFNQMLGIDLSLSYIFAKGLSGYLVPVGLLVILLLGIFLSGLYPAFVLSAFRPITVLKGKLGHSAKGVLLRKTLVVTQFSVTIMLLIGSLMVVRQIKFMNHKSLGFSMNQVLIISSPKLTEWDSTFITRINTFKEDLKKLSFVKAAATSWSLPGGEIGRSFNVRRQGAEGQQRFTMRHTAIDYDFINTLGIKLIAGRNFTPADHHPDFEKLQTILLNESAAKLLGFKSPQEAINQTIMRGDKAWTVVGVIADYHQKSVRYPIEPTLFMPSYSTYSDISVRLDTKEPSEAIASIRQEYDKFFPGNLFDYVFLDDRFNGQYKNEVLFEKAFSIFSILAIVVASLGLLGLTMFAVYQRTKEIGIRKVLGASAFNILYLVAKDFLLLVVIACIIAIPVAWWIMQGWLNDFAYRAPMSWWIFALAAGFSILIALLTMSYQAIKAAWLNPVKTLRSE